MKSIACLGVLLVAWMGADVRAQTGGYVERFDTLNVATSWWVFTEGSYYYPEWDEVDHNIWTWFTNDCWVFADSTSSGGKLTGDYTAAKIAGIQCDFFVDYPQEIRNVSLYFFSAADTNYYYYSLGTAADSNWHTVTAFFTSTNWFHVVGSSTNAGAPSPEALGAVREVGLRVTPVDGLTQVTYVNVDNFALLSGLVAPALRIARVFGQAEVSFEGLIGQTYAVQYSDDLWAPGWTVLPGYGTLAGTNGPLVAADTIFSTHRAYRVQTHAAAP